MKAAPGNDMKLSVVIPHRSEDPAPLRRCLASMAVCGEVEIIVVDSSDRFDVEEFKKFPIRLIRSDRPLRCGTARNVGVSQARGEYVWCVDADDALAPDALQKLLPVLGGGKDLYYLPWLPRSGKSYGAFTPKTFEELCRVNVAAWNKCCRRELYVQFPDYHPEDVAAHFELLDKVETFGAAEDVMYEYDDRNPAAYSRTYDWLKARPCNILALAEGDVLNKAGLRDEAVSGCLRTAADLYDLAHRAKKPEVRAAVLRRLRSTWRNIAAGYYIH